MSIIDLCLQLSSIRTLRQGAWRVVRNWFGFSKDSRSCCWLSVAADSLDSPWLPFNPGYAPITTQSSSISPECDVIKGLRRMFQVKHLRRAVLAAQRRGGERPVSAKGLGSIEPPLLAH